jgi:hypothetical protein
MNELSMVPHTCNPSYSGGRDQENYGSTIILSKKVHEIPQSQAMKSWVWCQAPVILATWEMQIESWSSSGMNARPYS